MILYVLTVLLISISMVMNVSVVVTCVFNVRVRMRAWSVISMLSSTIKAPVNAKMVSSMM